MRCETQHLGAWALLTYSFGVMSMSFLVFWIFRIIADANESDRP